MKKFKKSDSVIIISGSAKGMSGSISNIKGDYATVSGVNKKTIHKKPDSENPGKIITKEHPVHVSNMSHAVAGEPSRIGFAFEDPKNKKTKYRFYKKNKKKIDE